MNFRLTVMKVEIFILMFLIFSGGNVAMAQSQSSQSQQGKVIDIPGLRLEMFENAMGTPPSCGNNCLPGYAQQVSWVQVWSCVAQACNQGNKGPSFCFDNFGEQMNVVQKETFNNLVCSMVKSPGVNTRQALMTAFPSAKEAGWVEGSAYVNAIEGNMTACQDVIKSFVGPYGPNWKTRWYRDMSGCRILAKQRTRQEEENDFMTWLSGDCSKIVNDEMRQACSAPGAVLPDTSAVSGN